MSDSNPLMPVVDPSDHLAYMRLALDQAKRATPMPTNFCVGAVLVEASTNTVWSTGYTNELPGNTHAEQCALAKGQTRLDSTARHKFILYTTMEPCNKRASGNKPCTETILEARMGQPAYNLSTVYVGVEEPVKFVGQNVGRQKLETAGVRYIHVPGLEAEILKVATAGHQD